MKKYFERNYTRLHSKKIFGSFYHRPFDHASKIKVLLICHPSRISYSQAYPFVYYAQDFEQKFGAQIRLVALEDFQAGRVKARGADVVLLQTWFNVSEDALTQLLDMIGTINPGAKLHYLDSFAPTDLRLTRTIAGRIDGYIKKSLLRDRTEYLKPTLGDTNLVDFYSRLFNLEDEEVNFHVPESVFPKLKVGPTFHTGPNIIEVFSKEDCPNLTNKTIDVHGRMAVTGSAWYQSMRKLAEDKLLAITGISTVSGFGITHKQFMAEMLSSKICFSPFGYGEICWRDIEAIQTGSVLIKPSMEHLEMDPNIHIPYETYIPCEWDFSDLEEKIQMILNDDELRMNVAFNAYSLLQKWVKDKEFVKQFSYLFT